MMARCVFMYVMCVCVVDGSCMQSSGDIISLQDAYIDAFMSYCQGYTQTHLYIIYTNILSPESGLVF